MSSMPSEISSLANTLSPASRLPGDFAMWALIIMELSVFALLFFWYAFTQRFNPEMVATGRQTLSVNVGLICTLSLLCASYFVVMAVTFARHQRRRQATYSLIAAIVIAFVYVVAKLGEYQQLVSQGFDLDSNRFYTLYFFTTFFHLMHVIVGLLILGWIVYKSKHWDCHEQYVNGLESGASYWHMVDLVWVILFFIIYVSP